MSFRVFYLAYGERYLNEAVRSANSLLKFHPDARLTLLSPETITPDPFRETVIVNRYEKRNVQKSYALASLMEEFDLDREYDPSEWCLFLDTDTLVLGDLSQVHPLMGTHDIAMVHAPNRKTGWREFSDETIDAERDFNTGVIFFTERAIHKGLFSEWHRNVVNKSYNNDQTALSEIVRVMGAMVSTHVLTAEWNLRTGFSNVLDGEVRIIHGRGHTFDAARDKVNKEDTRRLWLPGKSYDDCKVSYE